MLRLVRTADTFRYRHGTSTWEGRRGRLFAGRRSRPSWPTIELAARIANSGHGRRHPYKWLRPGVYTVEMARMDQGRRALRILEIGLEDYPSPATLASIRGGRMYVHDLSDTSLDVIYPHYLRGCVGMGREPCELGVAGGLIAFDELCAVLGGFELGVRFRLEVVA